MNAVKTAHIFGVLLTLSAISMMAESKTSVTSMQFSSIKPAGHTIITNDPNLPLLQYIESSYGLSLATKVPSLPSEVLAIYTQPCGKEIVIPNTSSSSKRVFAAQTGSFPLVADKCDDVLLSSGFPYVITSSDLPFEQLFDTTQATNSGDFLGSAQDTISRPGGHDGFWLFTPDQTGTYVFTNSATKGDAIPVPDHDFDRGFGGIGIWTGECGGTYTEVGTANSLVGDSILPVMLKAGTTYTVVWEDFFVGSVENSVTLSIDFLGAPVGNSIFEAVDLSDLGWNFKVIGDTTTNQDVEDAPCVEPLVDSEEHGKGSGTTGAEIWYQLPSVTPGETYTLTVSSDDETSFVDSAITLHAYNFTTHEVSQLDCNDDISEDNRFSSLSFVAGSTFIYYAMIESVPNFDQPSFGTFIFEGKTQVTSAVENWETY